MKKKYNVNLYSRTLFKSYKVHWRKKVKYIFVCNLSPLILERLKLISWFLKCTIFVLYCRMWLTSSKLVFDNKHWLTCPGAAPACRWSSGRRDRTAAWCHDCTAASQSAPRTWQHKDKLRELEWWISHNKLVQGGKGLFRNRRMDSITQWCYRNVGKTITCSIINSKFSFQNDNSILM